LQQAQQDVEAFQYRSVCQQIKHPTANIHLLVLRSDINSSECIYTEIGTNKRLCQSSINIDTKNFSQNTEKASSNLHRNTSLDISNLGTYLITILFSNYTYSLFLEMPQRKGVLKEAIELSCKLLDLNLTTTVLSNL
ncbi:1645_t:CDS:2, partial [Racocetra persica]